MDEEVIFQRLGTPTNLAKAYLADLLLKQKFSLRKCIYFLVFLGTCGLYGMLCIPLLVLIVLKLSIGSVASLCMSTFKLLDSVFEWHTQYASHIYIQLFGIRFSAYSGFFVSVIASIAMLLIVYICIKGIQYYFKACQSLKNEMKI